MQPLIQTSTRKTEILPESYAKDIWRATAQFLADSVNACMRKPRRGPSPNAFHVNEVYAVLDMLLECHNGLSNSEKLILYLKRDDRLGYWKTEEGSDWQLVTKNTFQTFQSLLCFQPQDAMNSVNKVLLSHFRVHVAPEGAILVSGDESMIPGDFSQWCVYIPRKPSPLGMRHYNLATVLALSRLPVIMFLQCDFGLCNDRRTSPDLL